MADKPKKGSGILAILFLAAGLTGIVVAIKHFVKTKVYLKAGWNIVTYTGAEVAASEAFAEIMGFLQIAYVWNEDTQLWEQVTGDTVMLKGEQYNVEVNQDCTWVF